MNKKQIILLLVLANLQTQTTFTQGNPNKDKDLTTQQQKQKPRKFPAELLHQIRNNPVATALAAAGTTLLVVKVAERLTGKNDQESSTALSIHSPSASHHLSDPVIQDINALLASELDSGYYVITAKNRDYLLTSGAHAIQGHRKTMEDADVTLPMFISDNHGNVTHSLHGVFDGHGGSQVSELVSTRLPEILSAKLKEGGNVQQAIIAACEEMETEVLTTAQSEEWESGTTALFTVVHDNTLCIANIGDSRAVLCVNGKAVQPLEDHNPKRNPAEISRVKKAGGRLYKNKRVGHPKFNPKVMNIAVSRAFGDVTFKLDQYTGGKPSGLIATPELHMETLTAEHEFVILACDGVWDMIKNQEAVTLVKELLDGGASEQTAAAMLVQLAYENGSTDNITAMVIRLSPTEETTVDA